VPYASGMRWWAVVLVVAMGGCESSEAVSCLEDLPDSVTFAGGFFAPGCPPWAPLAHLDCFEPPTDGESCVVECAGPIEPGFSSEWTLRLEAQGDGAYLLEIAEPAPAMGVGSDPIDCAMYAADEPTP
jgi:hypothetical protein